MAKILRKPRVSTLLFYPALLILTGVFFWFMFVAVGKLTTYLESYQQSHIDTQYQKVFHQLFDDPDWGALYDMAGIEDTTYEGRQAFIDYMTAKVGGQQLQCFIDSNGISGKKCPVYLGDEQLGVFYMESPPEAPAPEPWYYRLPFVEDVVNSLKIQSWEQTGLTLYFQREQSVTVCTEADRIVYLNGVPLNESHVISTSCTKGESYLPEGLQGNRRQVFYEEGFLLPPEVTVTDLAGNPIAVEQLSEGQYTENFLQPEIPEDLKERVVKAAQSYSLYMIRKGELSQLDKYFERGTSTYRSIARNQQWLMGYQDYRFEEPVLTEYCRYSEDLFSVRINMPTVLTTYNNWEKVFPLDTTFFLRKNAKGVFMIYEMTNVDVQEFVTQVRLQFFLDGQLLETQMVSSTASQLTLPAVTPPEGKVFVGWFRETLDENGSPVLALAFKPDETTGLVSLSSGTILEPMELYARFEDAPAE